MDFLNQATGQLRELMLSMTPAARVTALLLLGVIGVSLGYLVQHQTSSPDGYLFNGEYLPGSVLGRAEAAIAKAGLTGYEIVGNRIRVPSNRKGEFLAAVADEGALPPDFHKIVTEALVQSPFASGDTRRESLKAAREQQLSLLVSDMAGIEQANVIFDIREARGLARQGRATASVSIHPTPGEVLDARRIKNIKKAVAGAIAELTPEQVVVTNSGDGSTFSSGDGINSDLFDDPYYPIRLAFERQMQHKIENLLHAFPGIQVEVTAELENTLENTIQSMTPEEEPAALRTASQEETDTRSEIDDGGRPGPIAQGPNRNNDEKPSVTVKNESSVVTNQAENFVGQKTEYTRMAALVPRGVRASIAVPTNYLLSVWKEQQIQQGNDPNLPLPDGIGTTLDALRGKVEENIKNMVAPLLPKELAKNSLSDVKVTFFDSLTPEPIVGPSTASQLLGWASKNFNTMTMAVVALVSLMMLRSMVKSIPATDPAAAAGGPTLALETTENASPQANGETGEPDASSRPRLRLKKGDSLKDDLIEIVREDPDAAAAILRSWIGNAG